VSENSPLLDEPTLLVRPEAGKLPEHSRIHAVHQRAFGRPDEANLVDALRTESVVLASLVAERGTEIVGHILFTRMWIDTTGGPMPAAALAPVAVLPEFQRRGIGAELVSRGLDLLRHDLLSGKAERIVIVLGAPAYYGRFGFTAEKARHLESPFPPDAFMALELSPAALTGVRGRVRYPAACGLDDPPAGA
jgi:putative acetyltransferase